jgi:peptidoglycan/xylan/chitin deacetylase (PgdA/CDA1 family)
MPGNFSLSRIVKLGVSLGVFLGTSVGDLVLRLFGEKSPGRCVILYYHSIPPEQRNQFIHQLETIQRWAQPVDVGEKLVLKPGGRYVGVTFDDAFENYSTVALPELLKRKIPSTVFVITNAIGKTFGPIGRPELVMTEAQVRALPAEFVRIGSHSQTHPYLPTLPQEEARAEIAVSRLQLEEKFGRGGALFSFPFGGFNEELVRACREAGYKRVFSTLPYFALENPDEFIVGRVRVDPTDWPLEFRLKLLGAYRWLPLAFSLKRRVLGTALARIVLGKDRATATGSGRLSVIQG